MKTFAIIAFAAASVIATAATAAEPRTDVLVSFADLDLGTPAGQTLLTRRINNAARWACAVNSDEREKKMRADAKRCFESAVSDAWIAIVAATGPQLASR